MTQRAEAFIVDALRTPTGRRRGSLAQMHGADLGGAVLKALVERHDIPEDDYDDVIFGCVDTVGRSPETLPEPVGWQPASAMRFPAPLSIGNVGRLNNRCTLRRRRLCPARWTWLLPEAYRP